jgi:hypothetical protein
VIVLPIKIESTLNKREHHMARARRAKSQRQTAGWCLHLVPRPDVPIVVKLTRIAPRMLDDDNAVGGMKSVRDAVAEWLMVDDADPRISWQYAQEKGKPRQYACRVEFNPPKGTT